MLWQDDTCAHSVPERAMATLADPIEAVAWRDDPCVRRRSLELFAEILEDGRMLGWNRRKVVERLVDARREAGSGNVVAENAAVHDLCKERGLWREFGQQVGDVLLSAWRKGLVVARAAAKCDDDDLLRIGMHVCGSAAQRRCPEDRRCGTQPRRETQEFSATVRDLLCTPAHETTEFGQITMVYVAKSNCGLLGRLLHCVDELLHSGVLLFGGGGFFRTLLLEDCQFLLGCCSVSKTSKHLEEPIVDGGRVCAVLQRLAELWNGIRILLLTCKEDAKLEICVPVLRIQRNR